MQEVNCSGVDFQKVNCGGVDLQEVNCSGVDFQETEFSHQQAEVLFGRDFTVSQAFDILDRDDNGQVSTSSQ